jgi:outer membrane protein assembly factor BamE (lipoprotein component of BamABCDE complex)
MAAIVALVSVTACDPQGRPYEDVRLARLKVGTSTEQDVVRLFGAPAAVRTSATGRGLIYPLGPEGLYTLLIRIGPDGRYQGRDNLLTRENFGRISAGMEREEVAALLGPPGHVQALSLRRQTSWTWRFLDGQETRIFVVTYDADGRVVSSAIEEDPRRLGGG